MAKSAKAIGKARARLGKAKAKAKPKMGKAKGKAKPTAWDEHVDRAQAMGGAGPDDGKGDGVTKKPAAAGASVLNKPAAAGASVLNRPATNWEDWAAQEEG